MSRLEQAFQDELTSWGLDLEGDLIHLAADMAQLLVRHRGALNIGWPERQAMDAAISARTGMDDQPRRILLDLALAPQFRSELALNELHAFQGRFGSEAAAILASVRQEELDLPGFVQRHGPQEGLLLLDSLFRVAAADAGLTDAEARGLERAADQLGIDGVLLSALFRRYDPRHASGELSWTLDRDRMTLGRAAGNDIVLSDPQVARHHCTLVRANGTWRVVDAGSGRPTLVDGHPVQSRPLLPDQTLRIGPWDLRLVDDQLQAFGHRSFTALRVDRLTRHIGDVPLLEDVSFSAFSGELIALVGPSGAGKTTLINAIAGIAPADSGEVFLGGEDFHAILARDPSAVGIVPQDDLVHPELTVEESLRFSGRLRHGSDVSRDEIDTEVDRVLSELGIEHIRGNRIGNALKRGISGGQRKRVNLGQELLTRSTRVLFLDEPTSGLDPRSSQSIVRQIRQLADDGRIVFLVTHDLTPAIMTLCDHLLVMVPGGRVGYFGPPDEASAFFEVATPDRIFDKLGERDPTAWAATYRDSLDHRKYVTTRRHLLTQEAAEPAPEAAPEPQPAKQRAGLVRQFATLTARYARTKLRDRGGLTVLAIQPPILALLIWLVFPVPTTRLMFMLSLSCLWFGMSMSVRELIIDRTIWRRERKVGVGVLPYLGSKVVVLSAMNALQAFAFTAIVYVSMNLADYGYGLFDLGFASVLTALVGLALGLMLSALYTSSEAAVGMLPLLLIPNICFSSIMVSLRDMDVLSKGLTWITIQRFAFDLTLKAGTHLEEPSRIPGKWDRKPITGPLYDLGLKGADVEDMGLDSGQLILAMTAFALLFLTVTTVRTWARDR